MNKSKIMRSAAGFLMVLLMLPFSALAVEAASADTDVVRVGYLPNYATINDPENLARKGYGYEFFDEISRYTGRFYDFIPCTLEEGLSMLQTGELDLIGPLEKNQDFSRVLDFPSQDFGVENILLCVPKEADIYFDDFSSMDGKRVGSINKTYYRYLDGYMQAQYIQYERVICNELDFQQHLADGHFDLALTSSMYELPDTKTVGILGTFPVFYAANKGNQPLLKEIDDALEEIYQKDLLFSLKLYEKYFTGTDYPQRSLSRKEMDAVRQHGVFSVGISPDAMPLQYRDKNGQPAGICVDYMNQIADILDIEVNYVFFNPDDSSQNETVDINLCYLQRDISKEDYNNTDSYLSTPISSVRCKNHQLKESYVVASPDYLFLNMQSLTGEDKVEEVRIIDSMSSRATALKKGDVDYILSGDLAMEYTLNLLGSKDYIIGPTTLELPLRILLSKELPREYMGVFNKAISAMDTRNKNLITSKNLALMREELSAMDYFYAFQHIIIVCIVIFLDVLAVVYILLVRSKRRALRQIVETDKLTGLYTEHKFVEEVQKILAVAQPKEYVLLSIDIDRFQYINEIYGYDKGSLLLQGLALQMKACYEDAVIARVNADQFLVLMKTELFSNQTHCQRCSRNLPGRILNKNYQIGISRGAYIITDPTRPLHSMIDYANSARTCAKKMTERQRPFYVLFSDEMLKSLHTTQRVVSSMDQALEDKEFKLAYQPKIDLRTGQIHGAEALVRWLPSEGSMIYPDEFIPVFEQNGFIEKLDFYVLESVCQFIQLQSELREIPQIAVNISIITLRNKDFFQKVCSILEAYHISPHQIELEITEGVFIQDVELASQKLQQLQEYGFTIAMDDFGSGYSSLDRLSEINFDTLKIDKGVLSRFSRSVQDMAVIRAILFAGREMGLSIVAEGIETQEQAQWLAQEGCDIGQGYYFSKPVFEKDFLNYLESYPKFAQCAFLL